MRSVLIAVGISVISTTATAHGWFTYTTTVEDWPPPIPAATSIEEHWEFKNGGKSSGPVGCCGSDDCKVYNDIEERAEGIYFPQLDYLAPWWRIQPAKDGLWRACQLDADPYPRCVFGPIQNSKMKHRRRYTNKQLLDARKEQGLDP